MLSRVAGSLYWMGRYVERAENLVRLLLVTSETAVEFEGLDDKLAQAEWDDLIQTMPGADVSRLDYSREDGLAVPYIRELLLDPDNPLSVYVSLSKARENARAVREAITREVFLNLNGAFRDLDAERRRGVRDPVLALDLVSATHRSILTALGAMEHTLSRDQGWTFLKLGEAIERTVRTLAMLRVKVPALGRHASVELPLLYARWRGLLRSVASLENFRRVHGGGLDADSVVRFLLFDPVAPRSVHTGLTRMQRYLDVLPAARSGSAQRIVGKLVARVAFADDPTLGAPDVATACDETIRELGHLHDAIAQQYFPA